MSDLVERLKEWRDPRINEALREIARLTAEVEKLTVEVEKLTVELAEQCEMVEQARTVLRLRALDGEP